MRVLVAFESSGVVSSAFRAKGHTSYSCDLLESEGDQNWHIQGDVMNELQPSRWDLIIAHPPCTHLCCSTNRWRSAKQADGREQEAIDFFLNLVRALERSGARWAVENPIGIMSSLYRKPDCITQPWMFGHGELKASCWWLSSGLEPLRTTDYVEGREAKVHKMSPGPNRWKDRSRTLPGVAAAIAELWDEDRFEPIQQAMLFAHKET